MAVVHNDMQSFEQLFVCWYRFRFSCCVCSGLIFLYFCVSLYRFIPGLLAFVVLGLVFSVPIQEIDWEERL